MRKMDLQIPGPGSAAFLAAAIAAWAAAQPEVDALSGWLIRGGLIGGMLALVYAGWMVENLHVGRRPPIKYEIPETK